MSNQVIEASYPLTFRQEDAEKLGKHLKMRNSVEIVGMKRVGISNFLRFFLYNAKIVSRYIDKNEKHLFIPVDLNDLIERELHPFWILSFKRLLDGIEQSQYISKETKSKVSTLFLTSIQTHDMFLTLENIRQATQLVLSEDVLPTFFFIRFDRIEKAITQEFFHNLQGLIESSHHQLSYVFTSFRPLDQIKPDVFSRPELASFSHIMDLKPANISDITIIYNTLRDKLDLCFTKETEKELIRLSDGHVQYLHLMLVILHEKLGRTSEKVTQSEILHEVTQDERIRLQSEEIWESLTKAEKDVVLKVVHGKKIEQVPTYLTYTGIITDHYTIFSSLFNEFLLHHTKSSDETIELSKKELKLFTLLKNHKDEVCERDAIIHEVWPEYEEIGVSDWTIDRLVARLRSKLTQQKSAFSIITVKTRGYKLV